MVAATQATTSTRLLSEDIIDRKFVLRENTNYFQKEMRFCRPLFTVLQSMIVAVNADTICESGAPMGKQISFARRNPTVCSSNDAGGNDEVCTTLSIDTSANDYETIKVNGGRKTYIASGLTVAKGTVFHIRTTGMEVKATPVTSWSVNM